MERIDKSIEINAPIESCYALLRDFQRYPELTDNLIKVRQKGDPNVWHLEMQIEGKTAEWDTEFKAFRHDNKHISWRTVRNADIANSGAITLESQDCDGQITGIRIVVEFDPENMDLDNRRVSQAVEQLASRFLDNVKGQLEKAGARG